MSRQPVPFAPETLESIRRAFRLAADRRHDLVSLEHLLTALLEDPQALRVLEACRVDLSALRHDLEDVLQRGGGAFVPNDVVQKTLYIGALFSTSVIMATLGLYVLRHPELHRIPPQRLRSGILAEVIASVIFAITFVVAVAFPAIGYWSMALLVLVGPVHAVLDRSLLRSAAR